MSGSNLLCFSLRFAVGIHRHFARPTIVPIAVGELLATRCERPIAPLLRICLSISVVFWIFFCVLGPFRVLLSSGIYLPPFEGDSRNIEPSTTASWSCTSVSSIPISSTRLYDPSILPVKAAPP
jgi:hypothetical protein